MPADLEFALLQEIIAARTQGTSFYRLRETDFLTNVNVRVGRETSHSALWEALWGLVGRRLVYFETNDTNPMHWPAKATEHGREAARHEDANPWDSTGYMKRTRARAPTISAETARYLDEALGAFGSGLYLSATVMVGVASEASFLETARAFSEVIPATEQQKLEQTLEGTAMFSAKFDAFRKRLEVRKGQLPDEFSDGMALMLDSVLDLLRRNRNDAGHPTGKAVDRDDCFICLQMASSYLGKLDGLKRLFLEMKTNGKVFT